MKPLIVLLASFGISVLILWFISGQFEFAQPGRIAMSCMLAFTAIGHFAYTKGMIMMVLRFIPYKKAVIYLTGFIEIAAAIGLQVPATRELAAWVLILFFIVMLPANIQAAKSHIDYQKGTFDGPGPGYLLFRIPLQLLFILVTYFSAIAV